MYPTLVSRRPKVKPVMPWSARVRRPGRVAADHGEALLDEPDDHAYDLFLCRLTHRLPRFHHGKHEAEHAAGDD
jgi:hypothetical protein